MSTGQITVLLSQINSNNKTDLDQIYALLYHEIKAIANNQLSHIHNHHTISATVLAHECYFKLVKLEKLNLQDRRHLLNYLAKTMRRYLIDQIRHKSRDKRKGQINYNHMSQILGANDVDFDLLEIDRLIDTLTQVDEHLADVFQQKLLFNFTFKELSEIFDVSERQIIRQWNQAKTLLLTMMENKDGH